MPVQDELGIRMKTYYEQIPKTRLMRRCPVAIRIDGRAFHTYTRGFQKPFDMVLMRSMQIRCSIYVRISRDACLGIRSQTRLHCFLLTIRS